MEHLGHAWLLVVLTLFLTAGVVPAAGPTTVAAVPVCDGIASCVVEARPGEALVLVVGCLTTAPGPQRVGLRIELADGPEEPLPAVPPLDPSGRPPPLPPPEPLPDEPTSAPPTRRTFHVLKDSGDFASRASYALVQADCMVVGRRCAAYVDRDCADPAATRAAACDAVRAFDTEVGPRSAREWGTAPDVDGDGRFALLFTPWVGRLSSTGNPLRGYVRVADLLPEVAPPLGNRCDMMYLDAGLAAGPFLRTVLAHEYAHAVVHGGHDGEEEGWLNEALAHLAEDWHGYTRENIDGRAAAFLAAPERYRLVVDDYHGAGLWRDPGTRGAAYLFLRWCADQYGPDLAARLVRSRRSGVANLEAATGARFADLFRAWTIAVALDGLGAEHACPHRGCPLHGRCGRHVLAGPRFVDLPLTPGEWRGGVVGTAAVQVRLRTAVPTRVRLTVAAPDGALPQVNLVRHRESPRP